MLNLEWEAWSNLSVTFVIATVFIPDFTLKEHSPGMQIQWISAIKAEAEICNHSSAQSPIANDWNFQNEKQSKSYIYEIFLLREIFTTIWEVKIICICQMLGQQHTELKIFSTLVIIYGPHYVRKVRIPTHYLNS